MAYRAEHNVGQLTQAAIREETKGEECLACERSGLAILPVRRALTATPFKVGDNPPLTSTIFDAPPKGAATPTPLCAGVAKVGYTQRVLRQGYLYTYSVPKKGSALLVEGYEVTEAGHFRKLRSLSNMPDGAVASLTENCVELGHDISASFIYANDVDHKAIWLAFANDPWSMSVINRYKTLFAEQPQIFKSRFQGMSLEEGLPPRDSGGYGAFQYRYKPEVGNDKGDFLRQKVLEFSDHEEDIIYSNFKYVRRFRNLSKYQNNIRDYIKNFGSKLAEGIPVITLKDTIGNVREANFLRNSLITEKNMWQNEELRQYQFLTSKEISRYQDVLIESAANKKWEEAIAPIQEHGRGMYNPDAQEKERGLASHRKQIRSEMMTEAEIIAASKKGGPSYGSEAHAAQGAFTKEEVERIRLKRELDIRLKRARETLFYDPKKKKHFDDCYVQWSNRYTELIKEISKRYIDLIREHQEGGKEYSIKYDYADSDVTGDAIEDANNLKSANNFVNLVAACLGGGVSDAPLYDKNSEPKSGTPLLLLELQEVERKELQLWQQDLLNEETQEWLIAALTFRNKAVLNAWKSMIPKLRECRHEYAVKRHVHEGNIHTWLREFTHKQIEIHQSLIKVTEEQGLQSYLKADDKFGGMLELLLSSVGALQLMRGAGWDDASKREKWVLFKAGELKLKPKDAQLALLDLVMGGYLDRPPLSCWLAMSEREFKRLPQEFQDKHEKSIKAAEEEFKKGGGKAQTETTVVSTNDVSVLSQEPRLGEAASAVNGYSGNTTFVIDVMTYLGHEDAVKQLGSGKMTAKSFSAHMAGEANLKLGLAEINLITATLNLANATEVMLESFGQKQTLAALEFVSAASGVLSGYLSLVQARILQTQTIGRNGAIAYIGARNVSNYLSLGGGVLSTASTFLGAYSAMVKVTMAKQGGELGIAVRYYSEAAALFAISGLVTGAALFIAIPLLGWFAFFISLAAGYYLTKGELAKKNPFDRWLYRCCFGKLQDEMSEEEMKAYMLERVQQGYKEPEDDDKWHDGFAIRWLHPRYKKAVFSYWYALWQGVTPVLKSYVSVKKNIDMHNTKEWTLEERGTYIPKAGFTENYYSFIELEVEFSEFDKDHSAYSIIVRADLTKKGAAAQITIHNWKGNKVKSELNYLKKPNIPNALPSRPISKVGGHALAAAVCKPEALKKEGWDNRPSEKWGGIKEISQQLVEDNGWTRSKKSTTGVWGLDLDPSKLEFAEIELRYWPNASAHPDKYLELKLQEALRYQPDTGKCYL